ncbi:hypothetical protein OHA25_44305 [Nonomuraea sp. NBC_00507]
MPFVTGACHSATIASISPFEVDLGGKPENAEPLLIRVVIGKVDDHGH